jgi:lysophospholipid acyltransferase (LPLAT)-like uncharacterized protein
MAKNDLVYKLGLALVPPVYQLTTALLFKTCRLEETGTEFLDRCEKKGPYIAVFWHYGIYYTIHSSKGRSWAAMVSASKDGEYVARLLERMGYETVRGSRGKDKEGVKALREMTASLQKGRRAAIVADGSQGPPRVLQPGALILASRTGVPILPLAWAADRYYTFRSWDRSIVPLPFATIRMCYGEPLTVPQRLRGEEFEAQRLGLENQLNDLYEKAWARFGRREH